MSKVMQETTRERLIRFLLNNPHSALELSKIIGISAVTIRKFINNNNVDFKRLLSINAFLSRVYEHKFE